MGGSNVPKLSLYRSDHLPYAFLYANELHSSELASNEEAWQETRDVDGMMPLAFPSDQMVWATATTQDATSWINLNDQGAGMAISVGVGLKYLVLAVQKPTPVKGSAIGDLRSIRAFGMPEMENRSPTASCDLWDHEGVLLGPGDSLYAFDMPHLRAYSCPFPGRYVRPGTPVYDLTAQDAIVHGRFFYSTSTSQSTAFAIVHNFVLTAGVTNHLHCERFTFLRRLMAMWLNRYSEDPTFDQTKYPHVPDVQTENGLKDVMAVGNILELGTVLDRRCYSTAGVHWRELIEMGSSRAMYRRLISIIAQNFVIMVGGKPVLPLVVFARSLVELAATIIVYKEDMESAGHKIPGCSFVKVKDKMVTLFQSNYPELLPKLHSLMESRVESLDWTGPSISITRRTVDHRVSHRRGPTTTPRHKPLRDFIDSPIYIAADDASEGLDDAKDADDDDDIIEVKMANGPTTKLEQGSAQVHKVKGSRGDAGETDGIEADPDAEDPDIEIHSATSDPGNQDTDTESEDGMVVESEEEDEINGSGDDPNPGNGDDGMKIDAAESTTTPLNVEESLRSNEKTAEGTGREDQGEASENLKSPAAGGSSLQENVSLEGGRGAETLLEPERPAPIEEDATSGGKRAPRSRRGGDKPTPTRIMTRGRGNAEKPVEPPEKLPPVTESSPWSETKVVSAGIKSKSPAKRSPLKHSEGEGSTGWQRGKRRRKLSWSRSRDGEESSSDREEESGGSGGPVEPPPPERRPQRQKRSKPNPKPAPKFHPPSSGKQMRKRSTRTKQL